VEGSTTLREIIKRLDLHFPLGGPKTMNGLLLEWLQDIPDAHVALKVAGCVIEIVQVQNQAIKVVKLVKPSNK
jgi:Mg2+/Co2+ transporter CorB